MRRALLIGLLLLLWTGPVPRAEEDGPVVAHLTLEPEVLSGVTPGKLPFQDTPPKDVIVPTGLATPRYARIRMADTPGLAIAFDANPESPRLWVDADMDGDLKEQSSVWMRKTGSSWSRVQRVLVTWKDEARPRPVELVFRYLPTSAVDHVQVYAQAHRRGQVELGGRLRLIALTDGRADLRFDDAEVDAFHLDVDGDGVVGNRMAPHERLRLGEPFRLGNEGWIATVPHPSGRVVEFRRSPTVPSAAPRTWPTRNVLKPGTVTAPPAEDLATLQARYVEQQGKPYAQRYATVTLIGRVGTSESGALLKRIATDDEDTNLRNQAVRAMGHPHYREDLGAWVRRLAGDAPANRRGAALQALQGMAHPDRVAAFEDTLGLSDTKQASAISSAASCLANERTPETRRILDRAFRDASVPLVRYTIYSNGLRNTAEGPAKAQMLAAAKDSHATLAAWGLEDLHRMGHAEALPLAMARAAVKPVTVQTGQAVARVLGSAGTPKAVTALLGMLAMEPLPPQVAQETVKQLRFLRAPESVAPIVKALGSKVPLVRRVAAEVLSMIPRADITKALLKRAGREKDADVLAQVLHALGLHEAPEATRVLLKQARKKDPIIRGAAIRALARLGFTDKKVLDFFLRLLDARRWEDRVIALDAAAAGGGERFLPKMAANLDHKAWQVRLAAVEALARLRVAAAIPPLIDALEEETLRRVRDAIADALFGLTGQNLYDDVAVWRRWWAEHEKGFEVPELIPERADSSVGDTGAGFYGLPVDSERILFVIDQSGSMSAASQAGEYEKEDLNRLDVAVREVLRVVEKLPKTARVNVILFHTTIHPWKDTLQRMSTSNRNALARHLRGQRPTGGTNLYDGIERALQTNDVDTVYVLSDGAPGSGKYTQPRDILRGLRSLNQVKRIAIHCVSIGMDSDLLRRIAKENGGRYVAR